MLAGGDIRTETEALITAIAAYPDPVDRGAEFRTVIVAAWPDGREIVVEGRVPGRITDGRRGGEAGKFPASRISNPALRTAASI